MKRLLLSLLAPSNLLDNKVTATFSRSQTSIKEWFTLNVCKTVQDNTKEETAASFFFKATVTKTARALLFVACLKASNPIGHDSATLVER